MFPFTKQERLVLISLAMIVSFGTTLDYLLKTVPPLKDAVNLLDSRHIYHKVDLNTATEEELVRLPYIGPATARRILEYRREREFSSVDELLKIKGVRRENFDRFKDFLYVKGRPS